MVIETMSGTLSKPISGTNLTIFFLEDNQYLNFFSISAHNATVKLLFAGGMVLAPQTLFVALGAESNLVIF